MTNIEYDLWRYEGQRSRSVIVKLRYLFFVPGFTFTYFFRKLSASKNIITKLFYGFFFHLTRIITSIQIPAGTSIGKGLLIGHFGTIVVNPNAVIGKNFNLSEGVLIGNSQGKKNGCPIIGDNVCVQANAVIVGGVRIGNDVLIAPGAFVNFDVPDNSIVIGNPGQIIRRESSPTKKYIVYPISED